MTTPRFAPMSKVLLALVLAFTLALPSGVAGAQYGGTSGLVVNAPVIISGDDIDIIGSGCGEGEGVTITIPATDDTIATTVAIGQDGDFTIIEVRVETPRPGIYPIQATCGNLTLTADLTVVDSEAERQAREAIAEANRLNGNLALTGTDLTTTIIKAATALIAAGCFLAILGRRREQDEADAAV